jgi:hypothetical protein
LTTKLAYLPSGSCGAEVVLEAAGDEKLIEV